MRPLRSSSVPPSTVLAAASLALLAALAPAQLTVTAAAAAGTTGALNNARGVSPAAAITLTFSAPLNPATVTAQNVRIAGRWSGPVPGTLVLGTGNTTVTFTPQRPLFASEIATLAVSRSVLSATGAPLTGGF